MGNQPTERRSGLVIQRTSERTVVTYRDRLDECLLAAAPSGLFGGLLLWLASSTRRSDEIADPMTVLVTGGILVAIAAFLVITAYVHKARIELAEDRLVRSEGLLDLRRTFAVDTCTIVGVERQSLVGMNASSVVLQLDDGRHLTLADGAPAALDELRSMVEERLARRSFATAAAV